jgi:hypothetical protein
MAGFVRNTISTFLASVLSSLSSVISTVVFIITERTRLDCKKCLSLAIPKLLSSTVLVPTCTKLSFIPVVSEFVDEEGLNWTLVRFLVL